MASRLSNPFSRLILKGNQRQQEVQQAADEGQARRQEGDGTQDTGQAGASEPGTRSATLQGQPTQPTTAGPASAVQTAAATNLARRQDDLRPASSGGSSEPGTTDLPTGAPAQTDSQDASSDSALAKLEQAAEDAQEQIRAGRGDVEPSVIGSAGASTARPSGVQAGSLADSLAGTASDRLAGTDPGAEDAANAVGQVTSGGPPLFGSRRAGVDAEIAIGEGLIGDQDTAASRPSVAAGGLFAVFGDTAANVRAIGEDISNDAAVNAALGRDSTFDRAVNSFNNSGSVREGIENAVAELFGEEPLHEPPIVPLDPNAPNLAGPERAAPAGKAEGPDAGRSGDPLGPDGGGGRPTAAQVAFREALRDALGARPTGSGDIDPVDDASNSGQGATGTGAVVVDLANNSESLIGNPGTSGGQASTGSARPIGVVPGTQGGGDIDPGEGDAFNGPGRGGNPEDVDVSPGGGGLGLTPPSSSTSDADDDAGRPLFGARPGLPRSIDLDPDD